MYQNSLDELYEWGRKNNSTFNAEKFMILRYGVNETLKDETMYFTPDMECPIEVFDNVRDLGIQMSSSADFKHHI